MESLGLWYRRFGEPSKVLTLERALLGRRPTSLTRVAISSAPINPSDLIPVSGAYRHRISPPCVAGYEGLGTVIETTSGWEFLAGRRVLPLRGPGTWQHYVDCDPRWIVMVPDDIGDDIAARAYINPLAAYLMLRRWPAHDKRVLLTAAGSSCALLLAQWAIEHGAREVFGIYRSPEHAEALAKLGTIPVSIKETENIAKLARQDALVFDAVGGSLATLILNAMPPEATLVTYGLLSGQAFSLDGARTQPQRFHLRDQLRATAPDEWQAWFRALWPLLRRVVLPATQTFPLGRWREALSLFQQSGRRVKPLLVMR